MGIVVIYFKIILFSFLTGVDLGDLGCLMRGSSQGMYLFLNLQHGIDCHYERSEESLAYEQYQIKDPSLHYH
jgi:hypothetical protein